MYSQIHRFHYIHDYDLILDSLSSNANWTRKPATLPGSIDVEWKW